MSRQSRSRDRRPQLVGPWRSLHAAVWLVGLAILFLTNWIWPGILILVALSLVLEAVLMQFAPQAFEDPDAAADMPAPAAPTTAAAPPAPAHRPELLPSNCPKCGGPTDGSNVKWTGPQSANCPYCGTNLPMAKS
jgi:hypothetical protein